MVRRTAGENEDVPKVDIDIDLTNEQVVLQAAFADDAARLKLARTLPDPQVFLSKEHKVLWALVRRMAAESMDFSLETIQTLTQDDALTEYVDQLVRASIEEVPANLDHHVEQLRWSKARFDAATDSLPELLNMIRDPRCEPAKVRIAAKRVLDCFEGQGSNRYQRKPGVVAKLQTAEIARRRAGKAVYPFGIDGLDTDERGEPLLRPGAAPGCVTVVTGVSGSGKSTVVAKMVRELARQGRRVQYGGWEMQSGPTLELVAAIDLGLSRTAVRDGDLTDAEFDALQQRMHELDRADRIRFLDNPFRKPPQGGRFERPNTFRNLDELAGFIADSGCDVFVADLLRRGFTNLSPDDEELALYHFQTIVQELGVHAIIVQQQRLKDIEQRRDKRPTREGIKGSSAWVDIADTILGVHRPALWKSIEDRTIEIDVLKQRFARWPFAVEFDWDSSYVTMTNGREIAYDLLNGGAEGGMDAEVEGRLGNRFKNPRRRS